MKSSEKGKLFFFVYVVLVSITLLVLAEVSVRAFGLAPGSSLFNGNLVSDRYLPFKPRPNSVLTGRSRTDEFDYVIEINSAGFRDVEHALDKPVGTFRILGLGDSTTYGGGALFEDTYLALVEHWLNARQGNRPIVEIIKAGIPRFYPETQRLLLEHYGLRYGPDLVIASFGSSDVIDTLQGIEAITISDSEEPESGEYGIPGNLGVLLIRHSHLVRIIADRYRNLKNNRPVDWDEIYKENGKYEAQWQAVESEFHRMAALANQANAKFAVLYIPDFTLFSRGPEGQYPPARLHAWAKRNDVTFIDPSPAMLSAGNPPESPLYWPKDRHPTPAGYKIIAEVLYEHLITENLVP